MKIGRIETFILGRQRLLSQRRAQDVARLVFHRTIPMGCAQAQLALQGLIEVVDCNARHRNCLKSLQSG